jgi:hypothetical protein
MFLRRALVVVLSSCVCVACGRQPATPVNALIEWGGYVADGDPDNAWKLLCNELKQAALGEPVSSRFSDVARFLRFRGQFYTDFETIVEGNTATQVLTVQPRGARDSSRDELWVSSLVREGDWKVCGFRPASELSEEERDRLMKAGIKLDFPARSPTGD